MWFNLYVSENLSTAAFPNPAVKFAFNVGNMIDSTFLDYPNDDFVLIFSSQMSMYWGHSPIILRILWWFPPSLNSEGYFLLRVEKRLWKRNKVIFNDKKWFRYTKISKMMESELSKAFGCFHNTRVKITIISNNEIKSVWNYFRGPILGGKNWSNQIGHWMIAFDLIGMLTAVTEKYAIFADFLKTENWLFTRFWAYVGFLVNFLNLNVVFQMEMFHWGILFSTYCNRIS